MGVTVYQGRLWKMFIALITLYIYIVLSSSVWMALAVSL